MIRRISLSFLFCCLLALGAGGCALGPDHARPQVDMPAQWRPDPKQAGDLQTDWWTLFQDPTLNSLVARALSHNQDIVIAAAHVEEARASLGIARSAQLPMLDIQAGAARQELSGKGASAQGAFEALGAVSFDIDFWGKYRRASEAAKAELFASEAAYRTVRLAVIAETSRAYFALLAIDRQLATSESTLKTRRRAEELYRSRFREGLSGEFEYRQSEVETTTALAQVQSLEIAKVEAESALAVLIGNSPRAIIEESISRPVPLEKLTVPDLIPAGLPSSLLERRPDIIEAEELLHAATADIGVAKAAFFPSISLTGLFGFASNDFSRLVTGSSREWSAGAGLLQPVFQGGRLSAELDAANARQKAAYAVYMKTVQNAFREVLNALTSNKITRQRLLTIETQVAKLKRAEHLAKLRYESGQSSFLEVLDAQRALFNAQIELAKAHQAQLDAVVSLCHALGGGWK